MKSVAKRIDQLLRAEPERTFYIEDIRLNLKGQTSASLSAPLKQLVQRGYVLKHHYNRKIVGYRANPDSDPYPVYFQTTVNMKRIQKLGATRRKTTQSP